MWMSVHLIRVEMVVAVWTQSVASDACVTMAFLVYFVREVMLVTMVTNELSNIQNISILMLAPWLL